MSKYEPISSEKKWRETWAKSKTFQVDLDQVSKPFYNLMMFPYPSGDGLHVGHVYAFGGADTYGRFKGMQGYDVFEPMGFDSFGIHSENFAIKKNIHPKKLTEQTTGYFRHEQLEKLGALFDWGRSVTTSDPDYYKWTQWLFLKLYEAGLAVKKEAPVDWCPSCKTVLADEQVIQGRCERCSSEVIQKFLSQWFFKITDYAERLLSNLEKIDWAETTLEMQKNWIGKSEGVEINFGLKNSSEHIKVFTTRPDTIFGVTFMVLAPEHDLVGKVLSGETKGDKVDLEKLSEYVKISQNRSEVDRLSTVKEKTGIDTGLKAINPLNGREIPIFVADYVLAGYGTGAVMGVPAHDQRDFEFAKKYGLPIEFVIKPKEGKTDPNQAFVEAGILENSGEFDGLVNQEAKKKISDLVDTKKLGSKKVNYHLRDWLISRQRYWGPPIPIVYCPQCGTVPVPEKDLPVLLPDVEDFKPLGTGKSPLAAVDSFVKTTCPKCGGAAERETDVSDTFLDSSWYFLRYPSANLANEPFNSKLTKKWLPVNMYIGGNEHAVLHLLYSRFITMVLHDLKLIEFDEPFTKFRAHGLIIHQGAKMSKSKGNVINPNDFMDKYGADTLRMYLLFIGPYEQGGDFSVRGIGGISRYLQRVWSLVANTSRSSEAEDKNYGIRNQTIKKVTADFENLRFNTAIAALMEFANHLGKNNPSKPDLEALVKMLAPLVPHFAEETWQQLQAQEGAWENSRSVHKQSWPVYEATEAVSHVTMVIQVNGKVRDRMEIDGSSDEKSTIRLALDREAVKKYIGDTEIRHTIFVKGKLVNFVTNS